MPHEYHPPLKRDESLQSFSRDHFMGLKAANRLVQASEHTVPARRDAVAYFHQCREAEIEKSRPGLRMRGRGRRKYQKSGQSGSISGPP